MLFQIKFCMRLLDANIHEYVLPFTTLLPTWSIILTGHSRDQRPPRGDKWQGQTLLLPFFGSVLNSWFCRDAFLAHIDSGYGVCMCLSVRDWKLSTVAAYILVQEGTFDNQPPPPYKIHSFAEFTLHLS